MTERTGSRERRSRKLESRWAEFVSEVAANGGAVDPNALVQYVLRESYLETTEDLRFYAEKVRYYNAVKKRLREELARASAHRARYADRDPSAKIAAFPMIRFEARAGDDGSSCLEPASVEIDKAATLGRLDAYICDLDRQLHTVGDDAQLATIDLQDAMQKRQQMLQMLSNILKKEHDTATAIISNMK